jgi:hypothetical protein
MSEEHERIRLLAEEVITSLPTRTRDDDGATLFPRLEFARSITSVTSATRRGATTDALISFLNLRYSEFRVPTAEIEHNIRELARLINSFQTATLAQIVRSILQRERNNIDPPDAIRVRSHVDSLSDLTGEHSDPRPRDPALFQIPAAARIPLVNDPQNPPELHSNDSNSMNDAVQSGSGGTVGYHLSEATSAMTESTNSRSASTDHGAN